MAEEEKNKKVSNATAPYNFVPLTNKMLWANLEENPSYSSIQTDLHTGEIHYHFTAETPILVAGGGDEKNKEGENSKVSTFFLTPEGKEAIPGSTMRGMIRSHMQILGLGGIVHDIHDNHIYFRSVADAKGLASNTKDYYKAVLDVDTVDRTAVPKNVKSGYLVKENGGYVIYPTKTPYLSISMNAKDNSGAPVFSAVTPKKEQVYSAEIVQYKGEGKGANGVLFQSEKVSGYETGTLLFTGKAVGKPNAKYIFPEIDRNGEATTVTKQEILSYQTDYEMRIRVDHDKNCKEFWKLPEEGEEKAFFYVVHEGITHFGRSKFLRIAHKGRMSDGIPENQKKPSVTFVDGILGYARKNQENNEESLRSRVMFSDCLAENPDKYGTFPCILGEPKPSFCAGYVTDNDAKSNYPRHYSDDEFALRGYKHYWKKEFVKPEPPLKINVASQLAPLKKGTRFSGVIRYKNLKKEELGLLLWALRLEEGCRHSIGMGKSLGMGRVNLHIDGVHEMDFATLYQSFSSCGSPAKETVEDYIRAYQEFYVQSFTKAEPASEDGGKKKKKKKVKELIKEPFIQDFFYLHKKIVTKTKDIQNLPLESFKNITAPLNTVAELREIWDGKEDNGDKKVEQTAVNQPEMTDMQAQLAALQEKFKKG